VDDPSKVLGNGVEAAILERERRHVEAHIRGEDGDKAANVAPLESCRSARGPAVPLADTPEKRFRCAPTTLSISRRMCADRWWQATRG
jgi:hypothetical protein